MTVSALENLMADLEGTEDSAAFARRWEDVSGPFARVVVMPWSDEVAGGAEVAFADGTGPSLSELEAAFGPFKRGANLPDGPSLRTGRWRSVKLLVYGADDADRPLDGLTVQRAWHPGT